MNYSEEPAEVTGKIFEEAKSMCETILKKLEKFVLENAGRMEKASSHKFLTLLLNVAVLEYYFNGRLSLQCVPDKCAAPKKHELLS